MNYSKQWQSRVEWLQSVLDSWLERARMKDQLFTVIVAIVIGVTCGYAAVLFRMLIESSQHFVWGQPHLDTEVIQQTARWKVLVLPAIGGLIAGPLIYFLSRESRGHGVPEVIEAVGVKKGMIRGRVALVKAFSSAATIVTGGSAGREGPIIQIGAALGSKIGKTLHVSVRDMRTFVGCGAAAGIAATFNAPIAGALFAIEIIIGELGVAHFSPIVISSVLATVISRHHFGDNPVFEVPEYSLVNGMELGPYALLGVLCALVSVLFIQALYRTEDLFEKLGSRSLVWSAGLGGLLLGGMGLMLPHVYGDGYSTINLALTSQLSWGLLAGLIFAKIIATSLTLGSGGSGGVFAPSLFVGAMVGGFVGQLVEAVHGTSAGGAGGYALVGMGGLVAGTTRAPITAILIIFEITNSYTIILPLMTVCIISTLLSMKVHKESIYSMKLVRRGTTLFKGQSLDVLKSFTVASLIRSDTETVDPGATVNTFIDRMLESDKSHFYVVDKMGRFAGMISHTELRKVMINREQLQFVLLAEDLANEGLPVCTPEDSLSTALKLLEKANLTELPVVIDKIGQVLCGYLSYADVIALYNEELIKRDTADTVASRFTHLSGSQLVRLADTMYMTEWDPPPDFENKTLIELQLPGKYEVHVALIKRHLVQTDGQEKVEAMIPHSEFRITEKDRLLIYGEEAKIKAMQKL